MGSRGTGFAAPHRTEGVVEPGGQANGQTIAEVVRIRFRKRAAQL